LLLFSGLSEQTQPAARLARSNRVGKGLHVIEASRMSNWLASNMMFVYYTVTVIYVNSN